MTFLSRMPNRCQRKPSLATWLACTVVLGVAAGVAPANVERDLKPVHEVLKRDQLDRAASLVQPIVNANPSAHEAWELLADIEWRRGNTNKAKNAYAKAAELAPKSATALAGLALVALDDGDAATAESQARQALERDKNLWLANYAMGRVFLLKGDVNKAFEHFEKGKKLKKREDARDLFESAMGLLALADRDAEAAENSLIKARALAPNTVEHIMNLADYYENSGQWGNAANLFIAMGDAVGTSPKLSYRLGRAYENQQRFQEAFEQYQKSVQTDSTYAPGLAALGHLLLFDTRRTGQALPYLQRAVEIRPTTQSQIDLGTALTRLGRAAEAVPLLEVALQADNDPTTRTALARAYVNTDEHTDKGLQMFETDTDIRLGAQADDMVDVGVAYIRKKDYPEARKWLDRALEKDPENVDAHYRLGFIELVDKNYESAIERFRKKLLKDPSTAGAWRNLGIAYQGSGDLDQAIRAYRKAAELAPTAASVWNQLAAALSASENTADAAVAYGRALQIDPANVTALRGRGFTNLLRAKYADAIKDLRAATDSDPDHADSWVWLGQALLNSNTGRVSEAKNAFEKAIQLDPTNESALEGLDVISSRGE